MQLRSLITPDDPSFRDLAATTHAEREDLRAAYSDHDTEEFDRWVAVNGVLEYPDRFGDFYPPLPPPELRGTGCGGTDAHAHLYSGISDLDVVADAYQTFAQQPIERVGSLLDFGSGCGRFTRWFHRANTTVRGLDVRQASIDWSQENLRGNFTVGPFDPPTELEDNTFDLVVALSLFSHFTRESNLAWLRELARVCKPDGLLIVTTHGALSLAAIANGAEYQHAFYMDEARARELLRNLATERFHYHEPPTEWREAIEVGANYGQAFMNEAFAAEEWSPFVDVLGCIPARLFHFQDVYALRPRG